MEVKKNCRICNLTLLTIYTPLLVTVSVIKGHLNQKKTTKTLTHAFFFWSDVTLPATVF